MKHPELTINAVLNKKYWIFDLDGTLTIPAHDFPGIRTLLGIPVAEDILGFIELQKNDRKQKMLTTLNDLEIKLAEQAKPGEGVLDLMEILDQRLVQKGIITRNTKENALRSLEKIGIASRFPSRCIIGREDAPPKPDPTGIKKLCSYWQIQPSEAVMVGDYLYDIEAGNSAGTATIHLDHEQRPEWRALTHIQVHSLEELNALFHQH